MLKTSLAIFSNRLLVRGLNLLLAVLIARALGPELQGIVSFLAMQAGLLMALATLGVDTGLIYYIRRLGMTESDFLRRAWPLIGLGVGLTALGVWLLYPIPMAGFSRFSPLLIALTCGIFATDVYGAVLRNLFLVRDQVARFNRFELTQSLLLLCMTAAGLALFPHAVLPVMVALLLSRLVTLAWVVLRYGVPGGRWTLEGTKPILMYSLQPWLGNLFSLLNLRLDTIFISWFIGLGAGVTPRDLGLYTICVLAIGRAQDVQISIQTAFFPAVAGLAEEEGASLAARVYRRTFPLYLLMAIGVCLGGYPALWAFGPEYLDAWPALCMLALGLILIRANGGVLALWFSFTGRPIVPTLMNLVGVGLNVALNIIWIPRYGIMGAAMATTASAIGVKAGLLFLFLRRTHKRWFADMVLGPAELKESLAMVAGLVKGRKGGKTP